VFLALKARRRPVVTGHEDMIGASGEVLEGFEGQGWARVHGENWRVMSAAPLQRGQKVRVVSIDGLTLRVEPETTQGAT
jgi:membrane-bound serine protease (ClpP class)